MGGYTERGYEARTIEELFQVYITAADTEFGEELEPYQGSFVRSLFLAFARAVAENQEQDLEELYDSLFLETASGVALTRRARDLGIDRKPAVAATGVVEWQRTTTGSELTVPSGTPVETEGTGPVRFETTEATTFATNATTAKANIQGVEGGTVGNVGANRITQMPSPPPGVSGVTNPNPTGDPEFLLTDGETQQRLGQNRETDEELRERALAENSLGGAATLRAVKQAIRGIETRPSLTVYNNRELTDNANGNGLPQLSVELVIYPRGATDQTIAETIHETISIGERLVNGINGSAHSYTITDDVLGQDRVIKWTEPTVTGLEITLDLVTSDGYAGDVAVERAIATYIGGTDPDGVAVAGLDVGDDVVVDELKRRVNSVTGVVGVASVNIDADGDGSDDTTIRADGLDAYEVPGDEVAQVDATTDITIN